MQREFIGIATQAAYVDALPGLPGGGAVLTVPLRLGADLAAEVLSLLPADGWGAILDQAREYQADRSRSARKPAASSPGQAVALAAGPTDRFGLPAWRIRKLRRALEEATLLGRLGGDREQLDHRAARRRYDRGAALRGARIRDQVQAYWLFAPGEYLIRGQHYPTDAEAVWLAEALRDPDRIVCARLRGVRLVGARTIRACEHEGWIAPYEGQLFYQDRLQALGWRREGDALFVLTDAGAEALEIYDDAMRLRPADVDADRLARYRRIRER